MYPDVNIFPLHFAVGGGHVGLAENLLACGADPNIVDNKGSSPLHFAVRGGHVGLAEKLLACGADPNVREDDGRAGQGWAVLHIAARCNETRFIPALIEAGADIEVRDVHGGTPLHNAAIVGSYSFMLALLQMGPDINKKDKGGLTPLHHACWGGPKSPARVDAVDLLLRWGADETLSDDDGKTPSQLLRGYTHPNDDGPSLERVTNLLAHAPQDRAWRRRGFVVMCRALPDRPRLVVEKADTAAEAIEQRPQQRPRRSQGFDGVAAWLMTLGDEDVFRKIMGFL